MDKTVGNTDKVIRVVAAIILFIVGAFADIGFGLKILALVASAVAVITAVTRICPLYSVLGISTLKKKE